MDGSSHQPHTFTPFLSGATNNAPSTPQSPNNQLTALLNNLMQMQSLENTVPQQQITTTPSSSSSSQVSTSPNSSAGYNPQLLLEQQIKLTQLQQLQQLQNQIFQQQIALISGQSPSIIPTSPLLETSRHGGAASGDHPFSGLPTPGPSGEIRPQQPSMLSSMGLGGYMEPLPHSLVPPSSSPSHQNRHHQGQTHPHVQRQASTAMQPTHMRQGSGSMNVNLQRQLQALAQQSQHQNSPYSQQPSSPTSFQPSSHPTSPVYHPTSPMHHPVSPTHHPTSPNTFGHEPYHNQQRQQPYHHHNHSQSGMHPSPTTSTPHSAPERIAFNVYTGPLPGGGTIPGLTLGPAGTPLDSEHHSNHHANVDELARRNSATSPQHGGLGITHMHIMDQDISPLTSPWLGAHPTSSSSSSSLVGPAVAPATSAVRSTHRSSGSVGSNKRMASSSGDEGGSARKKQSPAIRPMLAMSLSRINGPSTSGGVEIEKDAIKDRNGSISPLGSGSKSKGHTPPPPAGASAGGEKEKDGPPPSSSSASGSLSGSVSPNPSSSQDHNSSTNATASSSTTSRRPYRGSRSTNSTPLLRSTPVSAIAMTRTRSKSRAGGAAGGGDAIQDTPSPVDLNLDADSGGGGGNVDRSMPPPPLPASVSNSGLSNPGSSQRRADDGSNGTDTSVNANSSNGVEEAGNVMGLNMDMDMNGMGMSSMDMGMMGMGNMNNINNIGGMGMGIGSFNGMMGEMNMNNMGSMGGMNGMGMGMDMNMDMDMGGMSSFGMMDMDFGQQQQQTQTQHGHHSQQNQQMLPPQSMVRSQQPLVPVTPASIMNLSRLHTTTSSSSSSTVVAGNGTTTGKAKSSRAKDKDAAAAAGVGGGPSMTTRKMTTRRASAVSPPLKPLLPAGNMTPNMGPTLPSPMNTSTPGTPAILPSGSTSAATAMNGSSSGPTIHIRKTSHKAAEQKRRDSLKTTFDDLRGLLPPIALPTDGDVDPKNLASPLFHPTAPLLPGALPPRGPPKAGGEGPNKSVSKLQLLICANEYIRLLKGRVERRDDEVARLRVEVARLRGVVKENGVIEEAGGGDTGRAEELDLEKDLDAIERLYISAARSNAKSAVPSTGTSLMDDAMDEGDDEGDD